MRLWSIHPKYLDRQGLLAVWREGLLAQKVLLQGEYKKCPNCKNGIYSYPLATKPRTYRFLKCDRCKGTGKIKTPYYNHPQLRRFKKGDISYTILYLKEIFKEAQKRKYNFRLDLIESLPMTIKHPKLIVTTGQLEYEFIHLQEKLNKRNHAKETENWKAVDFQSEFTESHPLFKVVKGDIEKWEKVK